MRILWVEAPAAMKSGSRACGMYGALVAIGIGASTETCAQAYPQRVIRLVSPFAPGGGTDTLARGIGQKLTESMGQSVVVENRPGGGGVIGAELVAKAAADGYTIMLASPSPIVVAPHLYRKLAYVPLRDFAPVTLIALVPAVMAVHPSMPARSVKELLAFARARPGQIAFSSSGNGGTGHLAGEMMKMMAGVDMIHVPYKGTGPATTAAIAGEVALTFGNMISVLPHVHSKRLRALAVTTSSRSPVLPQIATVAETLPGYVAGPWYGVLAPAGTPPDIIQRLHDEIARILRAADMRAKLASEGAEPIGAGPDEFAKLLRAETERWGKVVRQSGMSAE